jgi:hypothetical protein
MGDWKPIPAPTAGKGRLKWDSVRVHPSKLISVSSDLLRKFGNPSHVVAVRNGRPDVIGLTPAVRQPHVHVLKVMNAGTIGRKAGEIASRNILRQAGKSAPNVVTDVPHHWDGDVLVLDLSGLRDAKGGQ